MNEEIEKQEDTEKHLLNKLPIGDVSNNEVAVCRHDWKYDRFNRVKVCRICNYAENY